MADGRHVSELLAEVFRRGGLKRGVKRAQSVLLWPQVAGPQLARFSRARSLVDGVLIVEVSDSETAMHLTLQRQRFLDVFRGKFGVRDVRDIRFQQGRHSQVAQPEPEPAPEPSIRPDPDELGRLRRALGELSLPAELSTPALRAAESMLAYRARRKAEGWRECTACSAPTPESGLCSSCRRYANEPLVRGAAEQLAVDPDQDTPLLSEEQRAVARLLAIERLGETLSELLPQTIAEPRLRPQLEAAARSLLALRLMKGRGEVEESDYSQLPPAVTRVLGRWG